MRLKAVRELENNVGQSVYRFVRLNRLKPYFDEVGHLMVDMDEYERLTQSKGGRPSMALKRRIEFESLAQARNDARRAKRGENA